jgi:hypothetical protein
MRNGGLVIVQDDVVQKLHSPEPRSNENAGTFGNLKRDAFKNLVRNGGKIMAAVAAGAAMAACSPNAKSATQTHTVPPVASQPGPYATMPRLPDSCAMTVPANGMMKLTIPDAKPWTLVTMQEYSPGGPMHQVDLVYNGARLAMYKDGVIAEVNSDAKHSNHFITLILSDIEIFYMGISNTAATQAEITAYYRNGMAWLIDGGQKNTLYRWPYVFLSGNSVIECATSMFDAPYTDLQNVQFKLTGPISQPNIPVGSYA